MCSWLASEANPRTCVVSSVFGVASEAHPRTCVKSVVSGLASEANPRTCVKPCVFGLASEANPRTRVESSVFGVASEAHPRGLSLCLGRFVHLSPASQRLLRILTQSLSCKRASDAFVHYRSSVAVFCCAFCRSPWPVNVPRTLLCIIGPASQRFAAHFEAVLGLLTCLGRFCAL